MISQLRFAAVYTSICFALAACVSVNIKPKAPEKAKNYSFILPSPPFEKISADQTDLAFRNQKNGHTIAMFSECSESVDPSLESLESDLISTLALSKEINRTQLSYNERTAIRSSYTGEMDGVPVMMDILVFKKNSCAYSLTLVGRNKGFEASKSTFEAFLKGFIAP